MMAETREDVSKSIVVLLVVLSVVISLLGTWVVLEEISNMESSKPAGESSAQGRVSIRILGENEEPGSAGVTGKVVLNIN